MQMTNQNKETSDSKDKSENNLFLGDPSQNIVLLQELMNLSPDIFFRIDLKGLLEYLSPSAENLLLGAKEKWNTDWASLLTNNPVNEKTLDKIMLLTHQGKTVPPCRLEMLGNAGSEISLEVHGSPIFEHGNPIAYVGLARDISNIFKIEASIKKQEKRAEMELALTARVHSTLIPPNFENDRISIAINYLPVSGVGGDYTNYKILSDGNIIFTICDVTGHGVPAALLVNRLDSEFERLAKVKTKPGHLLNKFNNFIKENFEGTRMFLSAFCGFLNFATMKLTYSNYGHPPQFLFQAKGSSIISLSAQTHLVGLLHQKPSINFEDVIDIEPGDRIICFTDGVVEADRAEKEMFGYERLKDFISKNTLLSNSDFNEKLIQEAKDFSINGFDDDICVLSIDLKIPSTE